MLTQTQRYGLPPIIGRPVRRFPNDDRVAVIVSLSGWGILPRLSLMLINKDVWLTFASELISWYRKGVRIHRGCIGDRLCFIVPKNDKMPG